MIKSNVTRRTALNWHVCVCLLLLAATEKKYRAKEWAQHLANLKLLPPMVGSLWFNLNAFHGQQKKKSWTATEMMIPWNVTAIILPHLKLIKDNSLKNQLNQKLIAILVTSDMTSAGECKEGDISMRLSTTARRLLFSLLLYCVVVVCGCTQVHFYSIPSTPFMDGWRPTFGREWIRI